MVQVEAEEEVEGAEGVGEVAGWLAAAVREDQPGTLLGW